MKFAFLRHVFFLTFYCFGNEVNTGYSRQERFYDDFVYFFSIGIIPSPRACRVDPRDRLPLFGRSILYLHRHHIIVHEIAVADGMVAGSYFF